MKKEQVCKKCGSRNFRKVWVTNYNASEFKLTFWEWIQLAMFRRIEKSLCIECE